MGARAAPGPAKGRYPAVVRAGLISVVAGVMILGAKFAAWFVTGSSVLLADAAESIVNVIAAAMATYSAAVALRPADADHPYGHGKAEALSAAIEGALIGLAASAIVVGAVRQLVIGPQLQELGTGMLIAGAAGIANLLLALFLINVGRRERSEAIHADGVHVLTDVATTAGGILALIVVKLTGILVLDPIVALIVAANILRTGWKVVRRAVMGLLDEADFGLIDRLAESLEEQRPAEWIEIHQLRARRVGASHHIDLHLTVPRYHSLEVAHETSDRLEKRLVNLLDGYGEVVVHLDPCAESHCPSCVVANCPVRSARLDSRPAFDRASLTKRGPI